MEKLVLALLSASRRLKRYFQAHIIVVIIDQPIKQLLSNSEITGRMLKWKFELEGYDIQYKPRILIKRQILANFIMERPEEESPDELMTEPKNTKPWDFVHQMGLSLFEATNNEAEYEALIAGLRIVEQIGMVRYLEKVKTLTSNFKEFSIKQVPRSKNKKADALSKIASTSFAHLSKKVLVEELNEKSINEKEVLAIVEEEGHTWMDTHMRIPHKGKSFERQKDSKGGTSQGIQVFGKVKFDIVAITTYQWIKAKPVVTITGNQVKKFVWDNIVCRFGQQGEIVSDNGKPFRDNPFKDWCEKLCICQCFASVKHPQINAWSKSTQSLEKEIKAQLDERSKDWIGELSQILWAHRTMIKSSNGETPFSLTYGTKAVIPAEIGIPTLRTAKVDLTGNNEALKINLDLIEEKREQAAISRGEKQG
ncbi:reverse transcriptase domain-containing protein [Tanacetum coccineum]